MLTETKTTKKLAACMATIVILSVLLTATTLALIIVSVEVQDNLWVTGDVAINLNDGEAIINSLDPGEEFKLFEPGMTVFKDFFIENKSTDSVFYRIYLDRVKGNLATVMEITVMDGNKVLYSGTAADMTADNVSAGTLDLHERKDLVIYFHYPEEAGNETQGSNLTFTVCAEAVQTRNNDPDNPF